MNIYYTNFNNLGQMKNSTINMNLAIYAIQPNEQKVPCSFARVTS